jgi:hypothetical protein
MANGEYSEAGAAALAVFAAAIADPATRRALAHGETTVAEIITAGGKNPDDLEPGVQDFLRDLSLEELRFLSRMQTTMAAQGYANMHGGVSLFKF